MSRYTFICRFQCKWCSVTYSKFSAKLYQNNNLRTLKKMYKPFDWKKSRKQFMVLKLFFFCVVKVIIISQKRKFSETVRKRNADLNSTYKLHCLNTSRLFGDLCFCASGLDKTWQKKTIKNKLSIIAFI